MNTRRAALLALVALAGGTLRAGPDPDPGVTVMDPVFVEASASDPWRYFTVPGFEVISHCPDSFNLAFAHALGASTAARLAVLPASFWEDLPTPMKVILYNREPDRKAGFGERSPIDLSWSTGGASVGNLSLRYSHPVTIGDGDTYIDCGNYWDIDATSGSFSTDPDSDLRLRGRTPTLPPWFVAGFEGRFGVYNGHFVRSSVFTSELVLPAATWVSTEETLALQSAAQERHAKKKPMPREFLALGQVFGKGALEADRDLWESESALIVRWGLFASGERAGFLRFVDRASREPATDALFEKCTGLSYQEAEQRLLDYLPESVTNPVRVSFLSGRGAEPTIRDASGTEVARIIGDWGRLEGRSLESFGDSGTMPGLENFDYQRQCLDEAAKLFGRIARRRSGDPLFLAAYGLYEAQTGDTVGARASLEAAAKAGVDRPRAYVELARIRLEEALPSIQEGVGDLDPQSFADIRALLTTARVQMPSLEATYDVLARALEHAPTKPSGEDMRPLDEALELFPRNRALAYKVADLYGRLGDTGRARAIQERAARFADSDVQVGAER